ncbi:MAG: RsmE family RNA methyltransferase, partial [Candidatus Zixiibacteriota bacterium]
MDLPVFYAPPQSLRQDTFALPADESRHAAKVLRLGRGDGLIIVDGLGNAWKGSITSVGSRGGQVTVRRHLELRNYGEPAVILTLAAGLSTGSRFDTVVGKGTELGVKRFVPVISEMSRVKPVETRSVSTRVRRLERVALAAMKQCRRSYRPEIGDPVTFAEYLRQVDEKSLKLLFHPGESSRLLGQLDWTQ